MLEHIDKAIEAGLFEDAYILLVNLVKENPSLRGRFDNRLIKLVNRQQLTVLQPRNYKQGFIIDQYEQAEKLGFKKSFRLPMHKKIELVSDNPVANLNWYFYKSLIIRARYGFLIKRYNIKERFSDYNLVKELSTYALVNGPKVKGFEYLIGIEHLFGFNLAVQGTSSLEKIKEWATDVFEPKLRGSTRNYIRAFRRQVRKLLHFKSKPQEYKFTAEQFCLNVPQTGTSGSAFDPGGPDLHVTVFDEEVKLAKNKFSKSAKLSVENKLKRLFSYKPAKHKANDKVEVYPKRRLIVSADYDLTLKMRFIDTWLSDWLHTNPNSLLWKDAEQQSEFWIDFMNYENKRWNIPLDQSAFDHHVSKEMVMVVLDEIKLLIGSKMDGDPLVIGEYLEVMNTIIFGLEEGYILYELKPDDEGFVQGKRQFKRIPYKNGVLSGWQWTSKINTICNVAEGELAKQEIEDDGVRVIIYNFDATGDDQNTSWKYLVDGILYWLFLTSNGFVIHPMKNFFSTSHNEYLRLYSTIDGVNGYPARTINKILWIYPGQMPLNNLSGKINDIYSRWKRLALRLRVKLDVLSDYLMSDIKGAKLPNDLVDTFLNGNALYGGKELDNTILERSVNYIPGTWKYHLTIHGEGYRQFDEFYGDNQRSEINDWFLDACKVSDKVGNIELKTEQGYSVIKQEPVVGLKFAITGNAKRISRPELSSGWYNNTIFSTSKKVMNEAFHDINGLIKIWNAPRSWVYDWAVGRVDLVYPEYDKISAAGARMLCKEYEPSAYYAMFKKRKREDKWLMIQKHYLENISERLFSKLGSRMFVL